MDGEDLDDWEPLTISVDFLKFKNTDTLEAIMSLIPQNLRDSEGKTLLHHAALRGHLEKTKFLISHNLADPSLIDSKGCTCFELACKKNHKPLIEYFKSLGLVTQLPSNKSLIAVPDLTIEGRIVACMYADNSNELLVNLREITNFNGYFCIPEYYEWTLLGVSAYFLAPKCMKVLIEKGCDPNTTEGDEFNCFDNVLNSFISVLPPENEEEYIEFNSGMECLMILLPLIKGIDEYRLRLNNVFNKMKLVGKGSSETHSAYESSIERKALGFRLVLGQILS